jgi:hypothetical protein
MNAPAYGESINGDYGGTSVNVSVYHLTKLDNLGLSVEVKFQLQQPRRTVRIAAVGVERERGGVVGILKQHDRQANLCANDPNQETVEIEHDAPPGVRVTRKTITVPQPDRVFLFFHDAIRYFL